MVRDGRGRSGGPPTPFPSSRGGWRLRRIQGPASDLFAARPHPGSRTVTFCEVTRPALVLGSGQPAVPAPVDVVTRRTGGGAVWLEPGAVLWADVELPRQDPLWDDDVGRAFWWLGQAWAEALAERGLPGATVHRGRHQTGRWGPVACFAGLGPGEVTVEGRKVVGLAQRRTREGALFQCAALLAWDPAPLASAFAIPVGELAPLAQSIPVAAHDLAQAFVRSLPAIAD